MSDMRLQTWVLNVCCRFHWYLLIVFAAGLKNMVVTLSVSLTLLKYVGCLLPSAFNVDCMSKIPNMSVSLSVSLVLEKYSAIFLPLALIQGCNCLQKLEKYGCHYESDTFEIC